MFKALAPSLAALAILSTACAPRPRPLPVPAPVPAPVPDLATARPPHALVPAPVQLDTLGGGDFVIGDSTAIVLLSGDDETARVARYLAALIGTAAAPVPPRVIAAGDSVTGRHIHLGLGAVAATVGAEGYELSITAQRVTLRAATPAGLFYGAQTMRQLLPYAIEYRGAFPRRITLPPVRILDYPRYEWRGAMLDVTRHFLRPDAVKRYIDLLALHKLNRLHLHLSDDQGWRIEIRSWPELALRGGSFQVGGGPGGYYTQAEYSDIVGYARDRFITVVPEIEMPGHSNAALTSYAELNCDGVAPPPYTGTRVGFSALCPEKEIVYRFVSDVVREIGALTPGPYFHMGGDEVERLSHERYVGFVERVQEIVRASGKTLIGWGEVASANWHPTSIVQHWRPRASPRVATDRGSKVILSPAHKIYLDMKYDSSTVLGLNWAGMVEVRDSYSWDPATLLEGVPESAILGVEAPLWAETVIDIRDYEYLAFPRLAAVAEVGWSQQSRRDWNEFRIRLGAQSPRWTALGINFYRSPQVPWR